MRLRYGKALMLAWMVWWAVPVGASDAPAVPAIEIAPRQYTFAPVVDGETVVHDFTVRNRGQADLEIYKVRTG